MLYNLFNFGHFGCHALFTCNPLVVCIFDACLRVECDLFA